MPNRSQQPVEAFAGLDVSAREISVARLRSKQESLTVVSFANNPSGHRALLAYLVQETARVRVCLEASGNYSLDLALALHAHRHVEVSVVNPRRARRFAESLGERSKTDPVDAHVLCEYAARMPWVTWHPPSPRALRLRDRLALAHQVARLRRAGSEAQVTLHEFGPNLFRREGRSEHDRMHCRTSHQGDAQLSRHFRHNSIPHYPVTCREIIAKLPYGK
jgi:transposase